MTALRNQRPPAPPSAREVELARDSSRLLAACIGRGRTARLRVIDTEGDIEVSALRMLVDILTNMAEGNAISLVPIHAKPTTQPAADFPGVSRPYLVGQLEKGELPHHKVGTHRRIYFRDRVDYRTQRMGQGKAALEAMTAQAQKLNIGCQRMSNLVAESDACALYPAPLCDLLMHGALSGLCRVR